MTFLKHIITFIRPHQWVKNLFVLIPAFFGGEILKEENLFLLLAGFISFSLCSSSIYIFNDIRDIEFDWHHPEKKHRPLPSGYISISTAWFLSLLFFACGIAIATCLPHSFLYIILTYIILNIFYSLIFKQYAIVDILIISFGFALRVVAGGQLTGVPVSNWLLIMIFLLSLFLGIAKRREDVLIQEQSGQTTRKFIKNYSLEFINAAMVMLSAVIVVAYLMYTMSEEVIQRIGNEHIFTTALFVITGILRYMQLTFVYNASGNPTKILLRDPFLLVCVLGWVGLFYFLIYL